MPRKIIAHVIAVLFLVPAVLSWSQAVSQPADATTIACRALEAHTDDGLKVTIVVFHQRDAAARSQLAALLREHSGEMVELQAGDGVWRQARLVRLKSCFGRGLLMLPAPAPVANRGEFTLRIPAK